MDEINYHILEILKHNSRESISSISEKVNLSRSSVRERILRMEESGIIEKYTIKITDSSKKNHIVFYTLMSDLKFKGDSFFDYMKEFPEVMSIDATTGKASYLVKASVSSPEDMRIFLKKLMKISTIESFISLKHFEMD